MGFFQAYVDGLLSIWRDAAPAARIGLILLLAICVAAIVGVGYWSAQPTYVTLVSNTDQEKMDRVIDALDKANIEYVLSGAGGNLKVNKSDFSKAKMLSRRAGIADDSSSAFGMGSAFSSPSDRKRLATLKKQQSLASTLEKIRFVDQASVHLNIPDKGPFERETSQPTASVLLTLTPGAKISDHHASSIASIVAFAVEDLEPENVQIADKDGNTYSIHDEAISRISSQIDYVAEAERKLASKAETQLWHFLGQGNASVKISLDLTFTNGSKIITKYDADGKVPSEEDLNTETTTNSQPRSSGVAGVNSNLETNNVAQASEKAVQNKSENIKTTYLVPKTEETLSNSTPIRNFMTVSVLVNSEAGSIKTEAGSLIEGIGDKVTAIVKNAVGFQQDTDTISVELLPFPSDDLVVDEFVAPYDWSQWNELLRNASLAIGALVALLIGFLTLRKVDLSPQPPQTVVRLDDDRQESIKQLGNLLEQNPEVFAQIIQGWSDLSKTQNDAGRQKAA